MPEHCTGPVYTTAVGRRRFLQAGILGRIGVGLAGAAGPAGDAAPRTEGAAKSAIQIILAGGLAQQESWDPKPEAPSEYRGPFGVTKTSLPGIVFSENLARTARVADKIAVVRSMTGRVLDHAPATYHMLTGHRPAPAIRHPPIGAVVAHAFGSKNNRPPYVGLAHVPPPAGPGCLICRCGACETGMDREANARDVKLYGEYKNPRTGQPFAIHRHLMLARRLIEAGVRFVTVLYSGAMGWDNHMRIKDAVESGMPAFDHAFAGLIADLDQRGLLDSTLVMVTSEFGRTPRINESAGRDHWARVYSCALAGGGIRRGQVYGASDATAGEPDRDPVTVEDLLATVYHQFGIRAEDRLIVPGSGDIVRGRVVRGLIG